MVVATLISKQAKTALMDVSFTPTKFQSDGQTIRGSFVSPTGKGPFPGVCKFHGLPGGKNQVGGIATLLAEAGFAVLTFDFRGFRSSEGTFSLSGEIADARAAVSHLLESNLIADEWIGVYGASYGGAVAVCAAAADSRIRAVCLRAPVYDTLWFAKSPLIKPNVEYLVENEPDQVHGLQDPSLRADTLKKMIDDAEVHNPLNEIAKIAPRQLLIVHGSDDVGIDLAGVKRLYELAGEPKELVVVEGADHSLSDPRAYEITMETVVSWFCRVSPQIRDLA